MFYVFNEAEVSRRFSEATDVYGRYGVSAEKAMERLARMPISLHCWQGDDVTGLESTGEALSGGIQATGNYPGKARNGGELRADIEKAMSLIPSKHRLNLHAMYAETGGKKVGRDELAPEHFQNWVDWARQLGLGLDFNPTLFSHPLAAGGLTLSSYDEGVRRFWVNHCIACRRIGAYFGEALGSPCVTNVWIPDGYKDIPVDRRTPRELLRQSLDLIFAEHIDPQFQLDAVESKLFGIGSESYVVGSHEFYLGYAVENGTLLTLDSGHFHPTESIADKISSVLLYLDEILLHVSRGVRWDSDHVVILNDELRALAEEIVRHDFLARVHIGLDFFDASINRIAAWTIGTRAMIKALLLALLEPTEMLKRFEREGNNTARLAMLEEIKTLPFGAVWDYYCLEQGVPVGPAWLDEVSQYEADVLSKRK